MADSDIKSWLYAWLGKKKMTPEYNIRPTGAKHRQRFLCELRGTYIIFNFTKKKRKKIKFLIFNFTYFFPSSWLWLQCVWKFYQQKRCPSKCCQRFHPISSPARPDASQWSTRWMRYGSRRRSCQWPSSYGRPWIESKTSFSSWVSSWKNYFVWFHECFFAIFHFVWFHEFFHPCIPSRT